MTTKTCFVISPIGEEGSDVRGHADSFLKLLVEPALSEFGFNVVRADQIASSSIITNDIVEYVQQSELCLVDLTFHNPNVFYECGRRHENGRPTIQLIKKGEDLPFDVAGIRTILYDFTDPWTTLESVNTIKEYIRQLESNAAYGEKSSGVSLSTIAETLRRIEKKLAQPENKLIGGETMQIEKKDLLTMHPVKAFHKCMEFGDVYSAKFVLQRLKKMPDQGLYLEGLAVVAATGDAEAKDWLYAALPDEITKDNEEGVLNIMTGLREYYVNTNSTAKSLVEMKELFSKILPNENLTSESRAIVFNLKQGLEYRVGNYENAAKDALAATKLRPKEPAYWYNLSICYKMLESYEEAAKAAEKFLKLKKELSPEHIEYISEVFTLAERESELKELLSDHLTHLTRK